MRNTILAMLSFTIIAFSSVLILNKVDKSHKGQIDKAPFSSVFSQKNKIV